MADLELSATPTPSLSGHCYAPALMTGSLASPTGLKLPIEDGLELLTLLLIKMELCWFAYLRVLDRPGPAAQQSCVFLIRARAAPPPGPSPREPVARGA